MEAFAFRCSARGLAQASRTSGRDHLIHYRVLMEPIGTNVFFLAPWARRMSGAYRTLQIDTGGAVSDLDSQRSVSIYEADSDISTPSPAELRAAGNNLPQFAPAYLQLPPSSIRAFRAWRRRSRAPPRITTTRRCGRKILADALWIHAAVAALGGCRSAGKLSFRAQAGALRIFRFFDGRDAAHARHSVARGQRIPQR